jgi:hypothetical protein
MKALLVLPVALAALAWPLRAQDTTAAAADTGYVEYHESPITLPLGVGLRIPSYDRVNGLTLPWGPQLLLGEETLQLDAIVSYRSNLGKWDPSLEGIVRPGNANEIKLYVGRGTFTNDAWIRSDLMNSAAALFVGSDSRNYYRADRVSLRFTRTVTATSAISLTPFIAGNIERDWSTGSLTPQKSPWSFFGRKSDLKMRRPNPIIAKGRINSFLVGSGFQVARGGLEGKLDVSVEHAFEGRETQCVFFPSGGSLCTPVLPAFTQTTLDSRLKFPTFSTQTFEFRGHAVLAGGDVLPPQRFAYLGGAATLATVNLLALGGDNLLYLQGDYTIPIDRILLPYLGSPFVALRYAAGTAGAGNLPSLIQNVGAGAGISFLRVDYSIDPAQNRSPLSRRSAVSFGVSLSL